MISIIWAVKIIFWGSALLIAYTYVGYPLLMAGLVKFCARSYRREPITPRVSIIIAAYNEEIFIASKLENCFQLDYSPQLMEVIVVSDGSTDRTAEIIANMQKSYSNLKLINLKEHVGKAVALNSGARIAQGDILIFTDARQQLAVNAVRTLVANFADAKVGAVSGELIFIDEQQHPQMSGLGFYWRFEKWLRRTEAAIHSTCGATGALYAIRRHLFAPIPAGLVLDDVLIPMRAPLAGYRTVFDSDAQVYDHITANSVDEFARKVRTLYGNYQLLALEPRLLLPTFNPIFWQFFSHKVCRLIVPFCLISMFISNLFLSGSFYLSILILQSGWYLLALAGFLNEGRVNAKLQEG
ncbi:MAG: glycosyltransferase family 2 protein [Acidobacteriota bacterium]